MKEFSRKGAKEERKRAKGISLCVVELFFFAPLRENSFIAMESYFETEHA